MKIEHIAAWVRDLEGMKAFYQTFFGACPGMKYVNSSKGFSSYFLSFGNGARLELMHNGSVQPGGSSPQTGYAHFAFSVGSKEKVDELTAQLRSAGFTVESGPRTTGDGYYESCILDPEGNRIEITV